MSSIFDNPNDLAQACSEVMHANDDATKLLGMKILESTPDYAKLEMTITKEMTNGHNNCHGGFLFTLADSAFAHACNNTNKLTVASGCSIEFLLPGAIGDTLIATAKKRFRSRKIGVYDIDITNQKDELVAIFRGKSYQTKGQLIPQDGEQ